MHTVEKFDLLVSAIYDAALKPELWPTALGALAESLACDVFHAFVWNSTEQRPTLTWASASASSAMRDQYDSYYGRIDPRRRLADDQSPGVVFRCHEHIDEREVARSEFYQDFLLPNGLRYLLGSTLTRSTGHETKIALLRATEGGPFSAEDALWAQRVVPHLQRATELMIRQQHTGEVVGASEQAFEHLETGVALLDESGAVLHLNTVARSMFSGDHGFRLLAQRISGSDARDARTLDTARRRLVSTGMPQDVLVRRPAVGGREASAVIVTMSRVPPDWSRSDACGARHLAIFSSLTRKRLPDPAQLTRLFELTPAEARLARSLAAGCTLAEAACDAGVKVSTVRSQLLAVLAKTGAKRQQELVALLARILPASAQGARARSW